MFDPVIIQKVAAAIIPAILAITVHEASHAYAAKYFGDDTADRLGRTSFNPMVHIDPIGTILLPLITLVLSTGFFFGYAKPVPVMVSRLRDPAKDMPMVALAGPVSNLVMSLLWMIVLLLVLRFIPTDSRNFFQMMAGFGVGFNLMLFAFNMLPILPLDGGRVLMGFLPATIARHLVPLEQYGIMIVMFIAFAGRGANGGLLQQFWINPIVGAMQDVINLMTSPLRAVLF